MQTKPKSYSYNEVVDKEQPLLMLSPGIFEKNGGMFSYMKLWLQEIQNHSRNYHFLVEHRFEEDLDNEHLIYSRLKSENKNLAMLISLLSFVLPPGIFCYFFYGYREVGKAHSQAHILTSFLFAYPLITSLFKFNKDLTLIYTLHDPIPHLERRAPIAKKLKEYYLRKVYKLSREHPNFYLHLHSTSLLEQCDGLAGKVIVHPHPLPDRLVAPKSDPFKGYVFGMLGRMEYYKGLDNLLEAFTLLSQDPAIAKQLKLVIVGSGELDVLSWQVLPIVKEIENRRVSEIEFHEYISSLDCLILPYKRASQSGVGYLALSYGIPIIATETGGLPDIIELSTDPRSRLIPPDDSLALRDAILDFVKIGRKAI